MLQYSSVWSPSLLTGTLVPVCVAPPSSFQFVVATPESASEAESVTVTSVLFHAGWRARGGHRRGAVDLDGRAVGVRACCRPCR